MEGRRGRAGGGGQEVEDRRWRTGGGRQEVDDRRWNTGDREAGEKEKGEGEMITSYKRKP